MQFVYPNTYKNYKVRDIYADFEHKAYNFPKQAVDVITIENVNHKYHQLNHFPIEYLRPVTINRYTSQANFESNTIASTLTEGTDYSLDYEMWVLNFLSTYTLQLEEMYEVIYEHVKINLAQFINHLKSGMRNIEVYFPVKELVEYTSNDANWAEKITQLDLTGLNFIDINSIYKHIDDSLPINFYRRGQFLVFKQNDQWYMWDLHDYTSTKEGTPDEIELPIRIEWSRKLAWTVEFNKSKIEDTLNQVFRFAEKWYDALLLYIRIEMYLTRLEYNESVNVQSLRLNTQDIQMNIQNLSGRLAGLVNDSSIAKWFYKAGNLVKNWISLDSITR